MPNNVIIVTNCSTDNFGYELLVKACSVYPDDLNHEHFKHMVLERGYELAEELFNSYGYDDFRYDLEFAEDKERGYTELQSTFYIEEQYVIWYEEGEMETIHFYGDTHECWTKPEDDDDEI